MTRELTAATEHAGVRLDAFLSADGYTARVELSHVTTWKEEYPA